MGVIGEDIRACKLNKNMVRDEKRWRGSMQVSDSTFVG